MRFLVAQLLILIVLYINSHVVYGIGGIPGRRPTSTQPCTNLPLQMKLYEIVPDVIDKAPHDIIKVRFPSGVFAAMGNELTPTKVKGNHPEVRFPADATKLYTFCMTDPDALTTIYPEHAELLHWLVINIPGDHVDDGEIIYEYFSSGPQNGSGLHRYVQLAYEQVGKITSDEARKDKHSINNRNIISIRDFAKKYNLGEPVSGNFYLAPWDDYVPTLYETFTDTF